MKKYIKVNFKHKILTQIDRGRQVAEEYREHVS